MKCRNILFLVTFIYFLHDTKCANILSIFHIPSQSHHILGSTLLKALAKRGHNITMISPFPFKEKIENYTDIELKGFLEYKRDHMDKAFVNSTWYDKFGLFTKIIEQLGDKMMNLEDIKNLLSFDNKFDLLIMMYPLSDIYLGFADHFNIPVILFVPIGSNSFVNYHTGNINLYSYVPGMLPFSDRMTFMERVLNTMTGIAVQFVHSFVVIPKARELVKKHFPKAQPLDELYDRIALALINSHYSTETPRPYTPNMIQIGGFAVEEAEPLPEELQKYLDNAKNCAIYMSFGSNIRMSYISSDKLNIILKTLSKSKCQILWKMEIDSLPEKSSNIKIEKWVPQKSVLAHPNVKLFITHGGMGSIAESTYAGVPMVVIPFFGDQSMNAAEIVIKQYAVSLKFNDMTEELFANAIDEVLNNPKYTDNIRKQSSLYKDQPIKPIDNAIFWVEHVIKHKGAEHLQPFSKQLNLFQLLGLDVAAFVISVLSFVGFLAYWIIKKIRVLYFRRKNAKKIKTN